MKKLLPLVLFLFASYNLLAQKTVRIGPSGGGTSSGFNYLQNVNQTNYNDDSKLGGHGGIKVDISLTPPDNPVTFRVSPEFFFNQNGTKDKYYTSFMQFTDSFVNNKIGLNYVGLYFPIKFCLQGVDNYDNGGGQAFYLQAAFFGDFIVGSDAVNSTTQASQKVTFDNNKDKMDFGCRFSVGVLVTKNFGFELGYNMGLKNIHFYTTNFESDANKNNYLINNRGFTLGLVTFFDL